ncbi:MAG: helix-turn-helix domain-containing protein [Bacillota bacterium]|uniref:helix-turn-helix domain-containing protein n=1 Tax=Rossellomorea sp. FM04394 TaxID=3243076 RepID=UPI0035A64097
MLEGKIIKFYREHQQVKQKDLGEGICSTTHISKIERGLTEVSMETIQLLSERLGIDMEKELENYQSIDSLLKEWHESIIKKLQTKADSIKTRLDGIPLLQIQDFYRTYTLILARYHLFSGENQPAKRLIEEMEMWSGLSPYEHNMLLHIKGIYQMRVNHDFFKAISVLKEIRLDDYSNRECFYDLAVAYHSIHSNVLAYFYANKALQFFVEKRSFSRMIESEMLMLLQLEQSDDSNVEINEYQRLIDMAEDYQLEHQRALLHHNYAYHQLRKGDFKSAGEYYKKSVNTRKPQDPNYLGSLEGYVNALAKEGRTSKDELLQYIEEGLSLARKGNNNTFYHFFTLHKLNVNEDKKGYYEYLEEKAYPHFQEMGYVLPMEHYGVLLFDYYMEKGDMGKANFYAKGLMEKFRKNNQFV